MKPKNKMSKPVLSTQENAKVRQLVDCYYGIQKTRIQAGNRIAMLSRDYEIPEKEAEYLHQLTDKDLLNIEKQILKELKNSVQELAIYAWLQDVKGIGIVLTAGLVSGIHTSSRFSNIAKLWKYCGQATEQVCEECKKVIPPDKEGFIEYGIKRFKEFKGKPTKKEIAAKEKELRKHICSCENPKPKTVAQRKRMGLPLSYSPFMKTLCWKIGEQFVKLINKQDSYYGQWLNRFKEEEKKKNPDGSKGLIHNRAKRKTVKLFLSHLWTVWRVIEGYTVTKPYCEDKLGHKAALPPHFRKAELIRKAWGDV